jgi:hypothetical protein
MITISAKIKANAGFGHFARAKTILNPLLTNYL